jgi:hypothetical protein
MQYCLIPHDVYTHDRTHNHECRAVTVTTVEASTLAKACELAFANRAIVDNTFTIVALSSPVARVLGVFSVVKNYKYDTIKILEVNNNANLKSAPPEPAVETVRAGTRLPLFKHYNPATSVGGFLL